MLDINLSKNDIDLIVNLYTNYNCSYPKISKLLEEIKGIPIEEFIIKDLLDYLGYSDEINSDDKLCCKDDGKLYLNESKSKDSLQERIKWTVEETDILRKLYCVEGKSVSYILKELLKINKYRTLYQIREYIIKNNLVKGIPPKKVKVLNNNPRPFTRFTQEELEIIKTYYQIGGSTLCQEKGINKDASCISHKARNMNLRIENRTKWTKEEIDIVRNYYSVGGYKLCQEKGLNKTEVQTRGKANSMGIKRKFTFKY